MAEGEGADLQELAADIAEARAACVFLQVVAVAIETDESGDRVKRMELCEGLEFVLGAVAERLRDIREKLSQE